jgi:hypothetical protein
VADIARRQAVQRDTRHIAQHIVVESRKLGSPADDLLKNEALVVVVDQLKVESHVKKPPDHESLHLSIAGTQWQAGHIGIGL